MMMERNTKQGAETDTIIMQRYRELARAIDFACELPEENISRIKRTFIRSEKENRDRTFAHCASISVQKGGAVRTVTQALMVYPAIKWIVQAKEIDSIIRHLDGMIEKGFDSGNETKEQYMRLKEIQRLLSCTVSAATLHLEQRESYFVRCEQFLELVKSATMLAVKYKTYEPYCARAEAYRARSKLADIVISGLDDGTLSQYSIRKYMCGLIEDVAAIAGKDIERSMRVLCNEDVPDNAELAYLYHNVSVLLREYKRLMSSEWYAGNKALDSAKALADSIHDSAACTPKCSITEFMQLIYGCLALLKEFPKDGEEMYQIIMLQQDEVSQKELCEKQLFMSGPKYYRMKKQATEILGSILWGVSADVLFDLLL